MVLLTSEALVEDEPVKQPNSYAYPSAAGIDTYHHWKHTQENSSENDYRHSIGVALMCTMKTVHDKSKWASTFDF